MPTSSIRSPPPDLISTLSSARGRSKKRRGGGGGRKGGAIRDRRPIEGKSFASISTKFFLGGALAPGLLFPPDLLRAPKFSHQNLVKFWRMKEILYLKFRL